MKLLRDEEDGELYVLVRSDKRVSQERSMEVGGFRPVLGGPLLALNLSHNPVGEKRHLQMLSVFRP